MDMTTNKEGKTFRDVFKYYKRKSDFIDMADVIDLKKLGKFQDKVKKLDLSTVPTQDNWEYSQILSHPLTWQVYRITEKPGLILIKNPFTCLGQRYWIVRCLKDFSKRPNHLNIDAHNLLDFSEDWWESCHRGNNPNYAHDLLKKLRWITLGYHHNWDTKVYSESAKGTFPADLETLCTVIAGLLNFHNFKAEAAIINFYHSDSSLSGHTDHSEVNLDAPLLSFSFGQSAIFLIGGPEIEATPLPILLESGDIIIMSKESRLCYHGVPKILPSKSEPWNFINDEENISELIIVKSFVSTIYEKLLDLFFWKPFKDYVSQSRINMNVRQVLYNGQNSLIDEVNCT